MIRIITLDCKLSELELSSKDIMRKIYDDFDVNKFRCPICNGECKDHGFYVRHVYEYDGTKKRKDEVEVKRVKCVSCGHTHAILPDVIVPYLRYGLVFILNILKEHFKKTMSIEKLCEKYGISEKVFYVWLKLWRKDKKLSQGALEDKECADEEFMEEVTEEKTVSGLCSEFFKRFLRSFMQAKLSITDKTARKNRYISSNLLLLPLFPL